MITSRCIAHVFQGSIWLVGLFVKSLGILPNIVLKLSTPSFDDINYIWCVFLAVHNILSLNWHRSICLNIYITKTTTIHISNKRAQICYCVSSYKVHGWLNLFWELILATLQPSKLPFIVFAINIIYFSSLTVSQLYLHTFGQHGDRVPTFCIY